MGKLSKELLEAEEGVCEKGIAKNIGMRLKNECRSGYAGIWACRCGNHV